MNRNPVEQYLSQYQASPAVAQAAWLLQQQSAALAGIRKYGFPTRRQEDWKYTDVQPILKHDFRFSAARVTGTLNEPGRIEGLDCYRLVFMNGRLVQGDAIAGQGIIIKTLHQAIASGDSLLEAHLNRHAMPGNNAFIDLNTAFLQDGCFISLADGAVLDKPLQLVYFSDWETGHHAGNPRNLILLGKQARATVIESYAGTDTSAYLINTLTEASLAEGAVLIHYKLQHESTGAFHIGNLHVEQHRGSRLVSHSISLGGSLVRNDIAVKLKEPGAEAVLNGLYMAGGAQHVDNHTRIDHLAPHTTSTEYYRGVLAGRGRGVFNGKVVVHPDAQKSNAGQANANLLLSADAEIDTKPELEIYADDVKCSHGATVGRLDENMLFYLRSRAIPGDLARILLTFAFAEDVITRLKLATIRRWLEQQVIGQLPDADRIREFMQ
jgi:Fe-S cluster assembly protein SufD